MRFHRAGLFAVAGGTAQGRLRAVAEWVQKTLRRDEPTLAVVIPGCAAVPITGLTVAQLVACLRLGIADAKQLHHAVIFVGELVAVINEVPGERAILG